MASNLRAMASNLRAMASNLRAMASNLRAMASNLRAMAANLRAMAANLRAMASNLRAMASNLRAMASNLRAMASNLRAMASNLRAMAANLRAMAANLRAMASNLRAMAANLRAIANSLQPKSDGFQKASLHGTKRRRSQEVPCRYIHRNLKHSVLMTVNLVPNRSIPLKCPPGLASFRHSHKCSERPKGTAFSGVTSWIAQLRARFDQFGVMTSLGVLGPARVNQECTNRKKIHLCEELPANSFH